MHTTQQALSINTEVCDPVGKFAFLDQIRWGGTDSIESVQIVECLSLPSKSDSGKQYLPALGL